MKKQYCSDTALELNIINLIFCLREHFVYENIPIRAMHHRQQYCSSGLKRKMATDWYLLGRIIECLNLTSRES